MKRTKNGIFMFYECGFSLEEVSKLCNRSVTTVKKWDNGKPIPRELKLLMMLASGRKMPSLSREWEGWRFRNDRLMSPYQDALTPKRIMANEFLAQLQLKDLKGLERRTYIKILMGTR
ncbi:hypothetical protein K6Y31_20930 [Motilimonas cestriensis]|uniref:HTH cro/C1-type domain-containing protein n=1 Tax=Motilimonas cestriensis TaxID=2742685 RepID=A0ABS8WFW5_9GAMM|nr:DUF3653 domain-containing protein [Motilimonas cestriensis]MCE2597242.1 hypothetical protein [Motilimonas cestriensis]